MFGGNRLRKTGILGATLIAALAFFGVEAAPGTIERDLAVDSPAVVISGVDSDDFLGGRVEPGDFNNDGILDLAAHAHVADGLNNAKPDSGEVYIFFGPLDALDPEVSAAAADIRIVGIDSLDRLSFLAVGDFNGDDRDDLLVGALKARGNGNAWDRSGEAYVFFGPFSPADPESPDLTLIGRDADDEIPQWVASVDLNGDLADDLVIGLYFGDGVENSTPTPGEVYVVLAEAAPAEDYLLVIDEDSIKKDEAPNYSSEEEVNASIADIGLREVLPFFAENVGEVITLHTGQVGDEGWFALKTILEQWAEAGVKDPGR